MLFNICCLYLSSFLLLAGFGYDPFTPESADAFVAKMEHYFGIHLSYEMRDLPPDYWGATVASGNPLRCTNTVYLDVKWYGSTSPLWKYVLVHEWVHTTQRARCVDNEKATELETLRILAWAKEWGAFLAGVNHFVKVGRYTMEEVIQVIKDNASRQQEMLYMRRGFE